MATGGPIGTVDAPNETSATGACPSGRSLVASNQLIPTQWDTLCGAAFGECK